MKKLVSIILVLALVSNFGFFEVANAYSSIPFDYAFTPSSHTSQYLTAQANNYSSTMSGGHYRAKANCTTYSITGNGVVVTVSAPSKTRLGGNNYATYPAYVSGTGNFYMTYITNPVYGASVEFYGVISMGSATGAYVKVNVTA